MNGRSAIAVALALLAVGTTRIAGASELIGRPAVESGDTLRFGAVRVRLAGIEAPHAGSDCTLAGAPFDCARIAATALMDLTVGAAVQCRPVDAGADEPPGGVVVARCEADGYDLSEGMTYTGWARAWPAETSIYRIFETRARAQRHGLWRAGISPPGSW